MKAIMTKYHGPGNVRGSRIIARDGDGNRITATYDDSLTSDQNHQAAAWLLCKKMNWTGAFESGWLCAGTHVHVFLDPKKRSAFSQTKGRMA